MSLYRDAVRALARAIVGEIPEPPATYAVVIPAYVRGPGAREGGEDHQVRPEKAPTT
jgi:hypothetical protein